MAVYGKLRAKNAESFTEFFPKTYASLVYMQGNTAQTVQSRITDIISGTQKVGAASNADNATNATNATNAANAQNATLASTVSLEGGSASKFVVRESTYVPAQGNYTNAIVLIQQ